MFDIDKILQWLVPVLSGAVLSKIVDFFLSYRKNELLNDQIKVDTGFKVGDTWEKIVIRLENQLERQRVEIERMGIENDELREELIKLRTYKNFTDAEK
jgi:hypothetical protein